MLPAILTIVGGTIVMTSIFMTYRPVPQTDRYFA
jgi:hypothetical protein